MCVTDPPGVLCGAGFAADGETCPPSDLMKRLVTVREMIHRNVGQANKIAAVAGSSPGGAPVGLLPAVTHTRTHMYIYIYTPANTHTHNERCGFGAVLNIGNVPVMDGLGVSLKRAEQGMCLFFCRGEKACGRVETCCVPHQWGDSSLFFLHTKGFIFCCCAFLALWVLCFCRFV